MRSIRELAWTETIAIRHAVLWPDKPPSFCHVDGDDDALHYGVYDGEKLISVASVYHDGPSARLRKFATLEKYRGQGVGSTLLRHILAVATATGNTYFWCDARESAADFYARFGLRVDGQRFYKSTVAYLKMGKTLP